MKLGLLTAAAALIALLPLPAAAQWLNYKVPGVPRRPDGTVNVTAAAPRLANGKPDLSGVWAAECSIYGSDACFTKSLFFDLTQSLKPSDVKMTPWAAAISAQRESRDHVDDPYGYCLPPGVPRIDFGGGPFKILQTPAETAFLYESLAGLLFRQVFTDGRPLPPVDVPAWLGYSIGRWDGETFVVDTTGFRDGGWLDTKKAHPNSDALRVTERFRRIDFGNMELAVTIDDPKAYLEPWTVKTTLHLQPDTELLESFCDENDKTMTHRRITEPPPEPHSTPVAVDR